MTRFSVMAFLTLALACTSTAPPPSVDPPSPSPAPAPEPEPTDAARVEPPPQLEHGSAYFVLAKQGIVELGADGRLTVLNADLRMKMSDDLLVGPHGQIWVLSGLGLGPLAADPIIAVTNPHDYLGAGEFGDVAFAPDGSLWVLGSKGIGRFANDDWSLTPSSALPKKIEEMLEIGFDREGRPWLFADHSGFGDENLYSSSDDGQWVLAADYPRKSAVVNMHEMQNGDLHVCHSDGLVRIRGKDSFEDIPVAGVSAIHESAISSTGRFALASGCEVFRFDPGESGSLLRFPAELLGKCRKITALAIDADDRIWAPSSAGLHVLGPDEGQVQAHPRGSLPELDDEINAVLVVGRGPAPLPASH